MQFYGLPEKHISTISFVMKFSNQETNNENVGIIVG